MSVYFVINELKKKKIFNVATTFVNKKKDDVYLFTFLMQIQLSENIIEEAN